MSQLFDRERHIRYFSHCLRQLPDAYAKMDTSRLMLVHFCVHALDLLDALEEQIQKQQVIDWIYSLQVQGGFCGGTFCCGREQQQQQHGYYTQPHIAMTYTALATLVALGDHDLSHVDRDPILLSLKQLQRPNGSFQAVVGIGSEFDMRFLYCACAISYMIQDWTGVDQEKAIAYIKSCKSYDGAIALLPGQEGHGGSTFCGVAALVLMGRLDEMDKDFVKDLVKWCVSRQVGGMQGRPNKAEDTCYSYWIGGTLRLLGQQELLDEEALCHYVMTCQTQMGGFGKFVGDFPDVLHSFYSMAWLSLSSQENELKALNCTLGICQERAAYFEGNVP